MIRIRKIIFGLMAASLLLLPACIEPLFDNPRDGNVDASTLMLSLTVDGLGVEVATRATVSSELGEENVSSLTLFFFEPSSDKSGQFVDWVVLNSPSLTSQNAIPTADKTISASGAYHVIGVANAGSYMTATDWEESWRGKSEAEFRNGIEAVLTGAYLTNGIASNNLLMNGSAVKTAGNGQIEMKLIRNVARFDVENKMTNYTLVSAQLRNVYTKSSVTGDGILDYAANNTSDRSGSSAMVTAVAGAPIKGKLYGFENRVTAPSQGDGVTTCLIVALNPAVGAEQYYRINIHPEEEGQYLRRNKVYAVNITDVNGAGYPTADDAYNGTKENELDYTINNWDLGDNGLIVSDSYSILALPVKTAQIGKDGATLTFDITTFSTLESPSPLTVKSKTMDTDLDANLSGNTLTVTATPLHQNDDLRNGSITLTYAGLEATMNIEQSLRVEAFLKLTYETDWSGLLSAASGDVSKQIYVNASGPWKATLIGDDGFSFVQGGTEISSANLNDSFQVTTVSNNPSSTTRRNAYVVVTLDADPLNSAAVVTLAQAIASNISINPLVETIPLNGSRSSPDIDPVSNIFECDLSTSLRDSIGDPQRVVFVASVTEGADRFGSKITNNNRLKVFTLKTNNSSSNQTGKLKITDDEGGELIINLIQRPLSLSVSVTQPTIVGPEGGSTGSFNLAIDDDAATCKVKYVTQGVGGDIFNHDVKLVHASTGIAVDTAATFLADTTNLKLVYPKIYFPNREIDIRTTVTFTTTAGATATYTFTQNKLASKGVNIWNLRGSSYGSLNGDHYIDSYRDAIRAFPGSFTNNIAANPPAAYPSATTYIHLGNQFPSGFTWTTVNNFRNNEDGIIVLTCDDNSTASVSRANVFLNPLGYTAVGGVSTGIRVQGSIINSRVGLFLTTHGKDSLTSGNIADFVGDGVRSYLNRGTTGFSNGGIPVLVNPSNENQVYLMIDPKNKIVFIGEVQVFDTGGNLTNNRGRFMNNFVQYVANAAKYGSHFTDMLREDLSSTIPAMWDTNVWGANAWPTRSN